MGSKPKWAGRTPLTRPTSLSSASAKTQMACLQAIMVVLAAVSAGTQLPLVAATAVVAAMSALVAGTASKDAISLSFLATLVAKMVRFVQAEAGSNGDKPQAATSDSNTSTATAAWRVKRLFVKATRAVCKQQSSATPRPGTANGNDEKTAPPDKTTIRCLLQSALGSLGLIDCVRSTAANLLDSIKAQVAYNSSCAQIRKGRQVLGSLQAQARAVHAALDAALSSAPKRRHSKGAGAARAAAELTTILSNVMGRLSDLATGANLFLPVHRPTANGGNVGMIFFGDAAPTAATTVDEALSLVKGWAAELTVLHNTPSCPKRLRLELAKALSSQITDMLTMVETAQKEVQEARAWEATLLAPFNAAQPLAAALEPIAATLLPAGATTPASRKARRSGNSNGGFASDSDGGDSLMSVGAASGATGRGSEEDESDASSTCSGASRSRLRAKLHDMRASRARGAGSCGRKSGGGSCAAPAAGCCSPAAGDSDDGTTADAAEAAKPCARQRRKAGRAAVTEGPASPAVGGGLRLKAVAAGLTGSKAAAGLWRRASSGVHTPCTPAGMEEHAFAAPKPWAARGDGAGSSSSDDAPAAVDGGAEVAAETAADDTTAAAAPVPPAMPEPEAGPLASPQAAAHGMAAGPDMAGLVCSPPYPFVPPPPFMGPLPQQGPPFMGPLPQQGPPFMGQLPQQGAPFMWQLPQQGAPFMGPAGVDGLFMGPPPPHGFFPAMGPPPPGAFMPAFAPDGHVPPTGPFPPPGPVSPMEYPPLNHFLSPMGPPHPCGFPPMGPIPAGGFAQPPAAAPLAATLAPPAPPSPSPLALYEAVVISIGRGVQPFMSAFDAGDKDAAAAHLDAMLAPWRTHRQGNIQDALRSAPGDAAAVAAAAERFVAPLDASVAFDLINSLLFNPSFSGPVACVAKARAEGGAYDAAALVSVLAPLHLAPTTAPQAPPAPALATLIAAFVPARPEAADAATVAAGKAHGHLGWAVMPHLYCLMAAARPGAEASAGGGLMAARAAVLDAVAESLAATMDVPIPRWEHSAEWAGCEGAVRQGVGCARLCTGDPVAVLIVAEVQQRADTVAAEAWGPGAVGSARLPGSVEVARAAAQAQQAALLAGRCEAAMWRNLVVTCQNDCAAVQQAYTAALQAHVASNEAHAAASEAQAAALRNMTAAFGEAQEAKVEQEATIGALNACVDAARAGLRSTVEHLAGWWEQSEQHRECRERRAAAAASGGSGGGAAALPKGAVPAWLKALPRDMQHLAVAVLNEVECRKPVNPGPSAFVVEEVAEALEQAPQPVAAIAAAMPPFEQSPAVAVAAAAPADEAAAPGDEPLAPVALPAVLVLLPPAVVVAAVTEPAEVAAEARPAEEDALAAEAAAVLLLENTTSQEVAPTGDAVEETAAAAAVFAAAETAEEGEEEEVPEALPAGDETAAPSGGVLPPAAQQNRHRRRRGRALRWGLAAAAAGLGLARVLCARRR